MMCLREFKKADKTNRTLIFSSVLQFILPGIDNISFVFIAFCDLYKFVILEGLEGLEIMLRASFKNIVKHRNIDKFVILKVNNSRFSKLFIGCYCIS